MLLRGRGASWRAFRYLCCRCVGLWIDSRPDLFHRATAQVSNELTTRQPCKCLHGQQHVPLAPVIDQHTGAAALADDYS
jgi:hypothetical protein